MELCNSIVQLFKYTCSVDWEKGTAWDSRVQSIFSFQRSYLAIHQGCFSQLFVIFDHAQQTCDVLTYSPYATLQYPYYNRCCHI